MNRALLLTAFLACGARSAFLPERWYLGPTANAAGIGNTTMDMLSVTGVSQWTHVRKMITTTGGALHLRMMVMSQLSASQQAELARASRTLVNISIEGGGYMCRPNGTTIAQGHLHAIQPFLSAGGRIHTWLIESVFSRTRAGCPGSSADYTVQQVTDYAATLAKGLPGTIFFLYDALPHYSVGSRWPPNNPLTPREWAMDLPTILLKLKQAMSSRGVVLHGYWADCPEDYSSGYEPHPGQGYQRIVAAAEAVWGMGLEFSKTFNYEKGGQTGDQEFFEGTVRDFEATAHAFEASSPRRAGGASKSFWAAMVETWYFHPTDPIPDSKAFTTSNTLWAVINTTRT